MTLCSDRFLSGYYVLKIPPTLNPFIAARRLEQTNLFDALEFDLYCELTDNPNDYYFPSQWNLTKIGMPEAWTIAKGNPSVILGIIDTGVKFDHPDLVDNLWVNPVEDRNGNGRADFSPIPQGDLDGLDNDGNGKTDDLVGWDFYYRDNYPEDLFLDGHGTKSAGVAAAITNNGIGIAGIAGGWGNDKGVRFMVLKSSSNNGEVYHSLLASAIEYGARNGAKVLNISLSLKDDSTVLREAVQLAVNDYGVVISASAGNEPRENRPSCYPAKYPEVIAVSATDLGDRHIYGSYPGTWLDVMAPSGVITTSNDSSLYEMN
ncbi:MAG: S8 family serine peptidase, partial [Ignavibacteria bacterium]